MQFRFDLERFGVDLKLQNTVQITLDETNCTEVDTKLCSEQTPQAGHTKLRIPYPLVDWRQSRRSTVFMN